MIAGAGVGGHAAEEIGPIHVMATAGVVDVVVEDEADAVRVAKQLTGLMSGAPKPGQIAPLADLESVDFLRQGFVPELVIAWGWRCRPARDGRGTGRDRRLMDHYGEFSEKALPLLVAEAAVPGLRPIVEQGPDVRRQWCERVFAPCFADLKGADSRGRLAQFVAICDVYTRKLLRLDAGLSRRKTEGALTEVFTPFTKKS